MSSTPSDIIDSYIQNHGKAKRWALFWVLVFCLLSAALIVLFIKNKDLAEENAFLKAQRAIQSADSAARAMETSLKNTTQTVEVLKRADTLNSLEIQRLQLYNRKLVNQQQNVPVSKIDDSLKKVQEKVAEVEQNVTLKPATANPNLPVSQKVDPRKNVIVYIQYMPGFGKEKDKTYAALKGYNLQAPELVDRISFNSTVKYFNETDETQARQIAELVSKAINSTVTAKLTPLKVPEGQMEVWLGQYKAADIQSLRKKINLRKY